MSWTLFEKENHSVPKLFSWIHGKAAVPIIFVKNNALVKFVSTLNNIINPLELMEVVEEETVVLTCRGHIAGRAIGS